MFIECILKRLHRYVSTVTIVRMSMCVWVSRELSYDILVYLHNLK